MVTSTLKDDREEMRLIKISRGVLEVEQFARRTTVYTVKSQTNDKAFSVLVRHPKAGWNYVLASRPEGTEDLADAYLVRLSVAAGTRTGTLSVTEQTPSRSSLSIWDGNALSVLEKLMIATDLNPEARKKLTPLIERRRDLGKLDEQLGGLVERRNKLDQRAYELRENIRAIEKNTQAAAQRQKWTKQLDEFTSEGNKLGAQLAEIEAKRLDARSEIQDLLGELEFESPASK